jgi:hypothetical protein
LSPEEDVSLSSAGAEEAVVLAIRDGLDAVVGRYLLVLDAQDEILIAGELPEPQQALCVCVCVYIYIYMTRAFS